jgi:hypothetical protein
MLIPIKLTKMTTLAQDTRQARERLTAIGSLRRRQLLCEAFKSYDLIKSQQWDLIQKVRNSNSPKSIKVFHQLMKVSEDAAKELAVCNGLTTGEFLQGFSDWQRSQ